MISDVDHEQDLDRGAVSRDGWRLATAGCSQELASSLCRGWVEIGVWRRSRPTSRVSPDNNGPIRGLVSSY